MSPTLTSTQYWDGRFSETDAIRHHRRQNQQISHDFLRAVKRARTGPPGRGAYFNDALRGAHSFIEIGCGTGEMAAMIKSKYETPVTYATDLSPEAVRTAQRYHTKVRYERFDILEDWPTHLANFSLAIASNVLEHFKDPWLVLDRMLVLAEQAIVLVPYRQPLGDAYDAEGGAGHVYRFTVGSFSAYRVVDWFTFATHGWQHRTGRERPLQLAVLLKPR